ncbi:MAG: type I-C CRISPR-associated protein Cas5c [Burkholderiaceae bacterium]
MKTYCLEVRGDFACFTRPEMKVERVSYDVITPSAARAVFESIFWKPEVHWNITRIEVLNPIRWINLRRNEVGKKVSVDSIKSIMKQGSGRFGLDVEDERVQRAGLFLRDVAYRLHARLESRAGACAHGARFARLADLPIDRGEAALERPAAHPAKYMSMFERRATRGQCVNQPYLGCREFAADFRLVADIAGERPALDDTRDLGFMLHDLNFQGESGIEPRFFRAQMKHGVIDVPAMGAAEVIA